MAAPFLMVFMGVAFVAFFVWASRQSKRRNAELDAVWGNVADALEGSFEPAETDWFARKPRRIDVTVDGVDVVVDHYTVSSGKSSTTYTRLVADAAVPAGMELKVYREHALSGLGRLLGFQDVRVGDRTFDRAFVVKSNEPDLAPAWLNSFVRKRLGLVEAFGYEIDNGRVHARRTGIEDDERNLRRAILGVAAFADGRRGIVNAWRLAAKRLGGGKARKARPWARLVLERDGIAVTVTADSYGPNDRPYTVVEASPQGALPTPFALSSDSDFDDEHPWLDEADVELPAGWALWSDRPESVAWRFTAEFVDRLEAASPSYVLVDEGVVQLRKVGVVRSANALVRLVELALLLAAPESTGPYR